MSATGHEQKLARAFVELADTLVSDYDVAELMHALVDHCVDLLDADAAGLLLSDQRDGLEVMASSEERTRLLELFQLQADEGPCLDCYRSGEPVTVPDLFEQTVRWPQFAPAALSEGYSSVHALPLRLREQVIGALNLFGTATGALSDDDRQLAQALADVATIGILQERAIHHHEVVVEQLSGALQSRVVIEQAKGLLAERGSVDMDQAFARLRGYARATNTGLAALAMNVVNGEVDATIVLATNHAAHQRSRPRPG